MHDKGVSDLIHYVVNFSGGVGSWAAARLIRTEEPDAQMTLLFADTLIEDKDTYRFLQDAADNIGLPVTRIADGRTPLQVFDDNNMLGNSRIDLCSRILKRDLLDKWRKENCDPDNTVVVIGIDITEVHRFDRFAEIMESRGWKTRAPLVERMLGKEDCAAMASAAGLKEQDLYLEGFPHANCGGACIKAGQAHWAHVLEVRPELFEEWERFECQFRERTGKDVAFLRRQRNNVRRPFPLTALRQEIEDGKEIDQYDWGGCGCAITFDEDSE